MILRFIVFLIINFIGLAFGSWVTQPGVTSFWYESLNKAPWTPPGWFFGFAWTIIMICFAYYMASIWKITNSRKKLILLYSLQWLLNALWNPIFFSFQEVSLALINIIGLTALIGYLIVRDYQLVRLKSTLLLPYFVWLTVATSLNAYILLYN